jgi:hypothetical protein
MKFCAGRAWYAAKGLNAAAVSEQAWKPRRRVYLNKLSEQPIKVAGEAFSKSTERPIQGPGGG